MDDNGRRAVIIMEDFGLRDVLGSQSKKVHCPITPSNVAYCLHKGGSLRPKWDSQYLMDGGTIENK